jgi:hypothetical protein
MLRRLAITALITAAIAQPAVAAGKGPGSAQPAAPVTAVTPQQPPQAGLVWAYLPTKAFHRATSRYYGKTANGQWMTEADAKAKGYRLAGSPGTPEKPVAGIIRTAAPTKPTASKPAAPKPPADTKRPAPAKATAAKKPGPGPGRKPATAKPAGAPPALR